MINLKQLLLVIELRKKLELVEKEMKAELLSSPTEVMHKEIDFSIIEKNKKSWSKDQQNMIDAYMESIGEKKQNTCYREIRFSKPSAEIVEGEKEAINILKNTSNFDIKTIASKLNKIV